MCEVNNFYIFAQRAEKSRRMKAEKSELDEKKSIVKILQITFLPLVDEQLFLIEAAAHLIYKKNPPTRQGFNLKKILSFFKEHYSLFK